MGRSIPSTRRNKTITSSACVGMCGHCPSECRWSRTVVWPSVLFSIRGKWEHHLDYLIENSWWTAIAFYLWRSGQSPNAFFFLALLIGSHLLDEFAKRRARIATGRLLDDLTPFDRAFRLIAARRNVYVWVLAIGFLLNALPQSYVIICGWAAFSAAIHLMRSIWICNGRAHVIPSRRC